MEKLKEPKTILKIILVVAVIAIIIGIILVVINKKDNNNDDNEQDKVVALSGTEYGMMNVKDIEVKYDKDKKESIVSFVIENPTDKKLEEGKINVILQNEAEQQLAGVQTDVQLIEPDGEQSVSITISGDLTDVKKIQLLKPE